MPKYWSIAPWPSGEPQAYEQVWSYDLANGVIVIGWDQVGDPSGLTRYELARRFDEKCPEWPGGEHQVWDFYNEIQMEDVILARKGLMYCVGLGRVTTPPWFDENNGRTRVSGLSSTVRSNFLGVEWQKDFRPVAVQNLFHRNTVNQIKDPSRYSDVLRQLR